MTPQEKNEFMAELQRKRDFTIPAFVAHYVDENAMESPTLIQLLGIDASGLSMAANKVLSYLESEKANSPVLSFDNFKWKVHAFIALQDLLFPPNLDETSMEVILQVRYFYYESKYKLTECIHSGLNGAHIGNNHLLRLFIEFNLLQLYYINRSINEQSYRSFEEYLDTGIQPGNTRLIKGALPDDEFCKPIRKRIQFELNRLSEQASHAYNNAHSPKALGITLPHTSIDSLYYYLQTAAVVDAVLWMYYVNLPLLFFPVDVARPFGFDPPAGAFASVSIAAIIKKSMPESDFPLFQQYAASKETAQALLAWYAQLPDMTDDEIWATADETREPGDTIRSYEIRHLSTFRSECEQAVETIRRSMEADEELSEESDAVNLYQQLHFANWRTHYFNL